MNAFIEKIENQMKSFLPKSPKVALKGTISSFVLALISSLICYFLFRNGIQPYHDIVVGNITLPGVFKNVDFYTYFTFVFVYIVTFLILIRTNNKRQPDNDNGKVEGKFGLFHIILGIVPVFTFMALKMGTFPIFNLCFYLFLLLAALYLNKSKLDSDNIEKLITSLFFTYLSSSGVLAAAGYFLPGLADRVTKYFVPVLWLVLCLESFVIYLISSNKLKINKSTVIDLNSVVTQIIVPLCLFSLINTRYIYKGNGYMPVQYDRFKRIVIAVIILLIVINIITVAAAFIKKKRIQSVFISTIVSFISVCFWDTGYNLLINTDQFHTGETAVVYQQIVNIGQKWGSEFVSVLQGLGFFLSWLNEVVFGGTYATYTQAQNLLLVLAGVLTVILLYPIIEHKWLILLIAPVMPLFYMNRIFLIAPVFLLLLNPKIIKSPVKWSYCYILTCILHILYQPTYGGAVAASLVPALFLIWYKEFKNKANLNFKNLGNKIKLAGFLISVIVIGVFCLPIILNALHFLRTNGYETMIGNGVSVMQTLKYTPNYLTGYTLLDMIIQFILKFGSGLAAVIIMLYMLITYIIKQNDHIKMVQGFILTVSAGISFFLMLPAVFTRIDPGISRIGGLGFIFFGFLIPILIYLYRKEIKIKSVAVFICGLCLCAGFYVTFPSYLQIHEKANSVVNIPYDAVYAKPEETGIKNLGYAFVQNEQYLHEAMVINEVCNYLLKNDQTYYDFTDKSVYYLLANRKVPGLYVSSMVAANEVLQNESIERLKNNDVPLIFVNQPLRYMGVSESLRSYRIYRYFIEQDYKFMSYKNCNFLVRKDINLTPIQRDIEFVDLSNKIGLYDDKIDESTYNSTKLLELSRKDISYSNSIKVADSSMSIVGVDPYIIFNTSAQTDFNKIQLIEINLKNMPSVGMTGQLFVQTEKIGHNEKNSIHVDIKSKRILIPLYKYDQFKLDSKLVTLRLDFDNVPNNTDVSVDNIKLYSLTDIQKEELAKQYAKLTKNDTDNRLDDAFHQVDLMQLPYQWGHSFDLMQDRFLSSGTAESNEKNVKVNVVQVNVHFDMKQAISGSNGEFLKLNLDYGDNKKRSAVLVVKGTDINGNPLSENFQFTTASDKLLIPVGSSPNCLQAKEITGFDLVLTPDIVPYEVKIKDAQMYQLTK